MSEHVFFITVGLIISTVLAVFGMKYWSAMQQARSRIEDENAYRALAEKSATAQTENANWLARMQTQLSELNARVAAVEKVLKAVE
ncbi:MAG TPA: hypothetical protein VMS78_06410 [Rhizomicrobium sp.]|nr:hypothetical protein [Rhizomicrobium sp.]